MVRFVYCLLMLAPSSLTEAFVSPQKTHSSNAPVVTKEAAKFGNPAFTVPARIATPALSVASGGNDQSSKQLDTGALTKYSIAAITQMGIFTAIFKLLDVAIGFIGVSPESIPTLAIAPLFFALSIRSRVFNPLNNQRPDLDKNTKEGTSAGFRDRVMPSWTPPGVTFPIMWVLIVGPMRAYSSALVFHAGGDLFCQPALLAFMFHLTCGDIFNTVNNTERRYGAAVTGVLGALSSAGFAASQYYAVDPFAGKLLGATCIWIAIASALIADTWRINPRSDGEVDKLYPVLGDADTKFDWFSADEK